MNRQSRIAQRLATYMAAAAMAAMVAATPAAIAQPAGHSYTVVINDMDFGATPDGAKIGDTIVWTNRDSVLHSVTARDHSFDIRLNPGQSATMPLAKAGRIPFYCLFHPSMRGILTVAPR